MPQVSEVGEVGFVEGRIVGVAVLGRRVGTLLGITVGLTVGHLVGCCNGAGVTGRFVGLKEGSLVGFNDKGFLVGDDLLDFMNKTY